MNISIYVFGQFDKGYTQYPDNYSTQIFKSFYARAQAATQVAIHRRGDLMYYAYIRKLDKEGQYLGLCAEVNGRMLTKVDALFSMFENVVAGMVTKGNIIQFDAQGDIVSTVAQLHYERETIDLLAEQLRALFDKQPNAPLPPVNYGMANDSETSFVIDDDAEEIVAAAHRYAYTYIYKSRGYNTAQLNSYKGVLARTNREKKELQDKCGALSSQLTAGRNAQRNMKWVSVLSVAVIVLGVILWNKVLFPSEVTHYETGDFVYYGPLNSDKKPEGIGVAIYPANDKQQRRYYVGNFKNGQRQDEHAMLLYKNGSFFYGSMTNDTWNTGTFYDAAGNTSYIGTFDKNKPYDGTSYVHEKAYNYVYGVESLN